MSLRPCPAGCGNLIAPDARRCPRCGANLAARKGQRVAGYGLLLWFLALVLGLIGLLFSQTILASISSLTLVFSGLGLLLVVFGVVMWIKG